MANENPYVNDAEADAQRAQRARAQQVRAQQVRAQQGRTQTSRAQAGQSQQVHRAQAGQQAQVRTRSARPTQANAGTTRAAAGTAAGNAAYQQAARRAQTTQASAAHLSRGNSGYAATSHYASRSAQRNAQRGAAAYDANPSRNSAYKRQKRRSPVGPIIFFIALLALLGGLGWFAFNELTKNFDVSINGSEITVTRGDTLSKLIEEGKVQTAPGNLLAVDGSLLEAGSGQLCTVTMNGEPADENTEIRRDSVIEIGPGGDLTEEFTTSEEVLPAETAGDEATFENYWVGAIHLLSDGKDGKQVVKTGTISGKTVSEVVEPAVNKGYHIYSAQPDDKVIALTFDDGPWPETTDAILDILEANNAKATFFTIGNQIPEYPEQVRRAHEMGCEVLTHSWDHAAGSGQGVNMTYMSADEQREEISKGIKAITDVIGEEPAHIMRAPGGNFYDSLVDNVWDMLDAEIGWDLDTQDWRLPGSDSIAEVLESATSGSVILMHDGGGDRTQTVEALRTALPKLAAEGYRFVTISELLEYGMPESMNSSTAE
ncbi:MAG: polysaccharide deacetylase family protein [Atopobiaceae bacterium]|nr:polysaccharide deacetylase family protein [Atopobiaceae bacterium]